jgi:hypothetical protein
MRQKRLGGEAMSSKQLPMEREKPKKKVGVSMTEAQLKRLDVFKQHTGMSSRSEVVRLLIDAYLDDLYDASDLI